MKIDRISALVQEAAKKGTTRNRRKEILDELSQGLWRKPRENALHTLEKIRVGLIKSSISHLLSEAHRDPFRILPIAQMIGALRNPQFSFGHSSRKKRLTKAA